MSQITQNFWYDRVNIVNKHLICPAIHGFPVLINYVEHLQYHNRETARWYRLGDSSRQQHIKQIRPGMLIMQHVGRIFYITLPTPQQRFELVITLRIPTKQLYHAMANMKPMYCDWYLLFHRGHGLLSSHTFFLVFTALNINIKLVSWSIELRLFYIQVLYTTLRWMPLNVYIMWTTF